MTVGIQEGPTEEIRVNGSHYLHPRTQTIPYLVATVAWFSKASTPESGLDLMQGSWSDPSTSTEWVPGVVLDHGLDFAS